MQANLAEIASTIAEPSRAAILVALMDGRMHPASELAYMAKIKPQTASFHLAKLLSSSIVSMEKQGRHRYFKLNPGAAGLLESLMSIAPTTPVKSLRESTQAKAIKQARTCYDHFAGEFGVALTDSMVNQGYLLEQENDYQITPSGLQFFTDFGIDLSGLRSARRSFSKKCIDWSERKYHLAGALGKGLVERFQVLNWVEPLAGSRAIRITAGGKEGIKKWFPFEG